MKIFKIAAAFLIVELIMFTSSVKATVELTEEQYNNLHKLFSTGKIASLTDEQIEYYLSFDLEKTNLVQKYYKVKETKNGISYREVSESEAESAFAAGLNGSSYDDYKKGNTRSHDISDLGFRKISITETPTGITNKSFITVYNEWFVEPSIKSYDVIATRLLNATYSEASITGLQAYYVPSYGSYQFVNYSYNGTNIQKYTKGFGISMNLVDAATLFANDIDYTATATAVGSRAFGAYSHANDDVSLAYSKSYTISSAGYGNVIAFTQTVLPYYAGYPGVYIDIPYTP